MSNAYTKLDKQLAEGRATEELRTRAMLGQGTRADMPLFYRYVVLETVFDPTIVDSNKIAYFEHALGVSNIHLAAVLPRNTIVAKRVLGPSTSEIQPAMFLFPFFPPALSFPCQPGEHVWVMFENQDGTKNDLGYWMCRIVEPGFVEDANHTHAPRTNDPSFVPGIKEIYDGTDKPVYELRNGRAGIRDGERYTIAETATIAGEEDSYERIKENSDGGRVGVREAVPRFRKRPGDIALEGSNNALVVIGRDRTGAVATYKVDDGVRMLIADGVPDADDQLPGAGAIDIVAGRGQTERTLGKEVDTKKISGSSIGTKELGKSTTELVPDEGDPDFASDRSRVYVAQRTRVDSNLGLNGFNVELSSGPFQGGTDQTKKEVVDSRDGDGAIVIKSDKLRLIARSDIEIVVSSYTERDESGRLVENNSSDSWAVVAIKANGDIVFRPAKHGYIKLGDDSADKALVCSDLPATAENGVVHGAPLVTTMGGLFAGAKPSGNSNSAALSPGQGSFASKILVK